MKEVLTKGFWRGVVKTFYEGLEATPPKPQTPQAPPPAASQEDSQPAPDAKSTPPTT